MSDREEALIEALRKYARALPVGHENTERGASSYNWIMHCADVLDALRVVMPPHTGDAR
jgi:hypothetical protein